MKVLLDTHALIWMLERNARLSRHAARVLDDPVHEVLVSAASAYEIFLKHTQGKLPSVSVLIANFTGEITAANCMPLPITIAHAEAAGQLPMTHKDPFDRVLIAQALIERIPLVSNEAIFDSFGVERIW